MKILPWLFLTLLLAMCVVIGALFFTDASPPLGPHPVHASMTRGSVEHQRDGAIVALGAAFGALQIVFFITCLVFGVGERGRPFVVFFVGGVLHLLVFAAMVLTHERYLADETASLVLSLPAPTAWMLYALWPLPVIFAAWYSIRFDRVVYPKESRTRFAALLRGLREGATAVRDSSETEELR